MTPTDELPDDLADLAAERLLTVDGSERERAFAALLAEFPQHVAALHRLRADLAGAEGLLAETFPEPGTEREQQIGCYRVQCVLGEGAFGIVYLCAQERPVVRNVAIKVLRPGVGDRKTLQRFTAERQLLAALNHPAITQVFDAGELPDGRPYFVMEFVDGTAISRYCLDQRLPCNEKLRLFVELCHGVAYAHRRGIVHRDLKPANVLVVATERGPMPKIIDFGIAKVLFATDGDAMPRTDAGRVIGTPGYMSPEQAAGRSAEIDERADVFALGVILYELLTGHLPWPQGAADTASDPPRPSARSTVAAELRGDLDWITLHALARDRSERYPSVSALLLDVERHLRGETVSVGPPTLRYRLRKFVRRNRTTVAAIGGAVALVTVGLGVAFAYGRAAHAEVSATRELADAEVSAAKGVADASFTEAIAAIDQLVARADDPALRDAPADDAPRQALLRDAIASYDRLQAVRPRDAKLRVRACQAMTNLAQVHIKLGQLDRATAIAREAQDAARALFSADPGSNVCRALYAETLRREGMALAIAGKHGEAHVRFVAAGEELAACHAADPLTYGLGYAAVLREQADTIARNQFEARLARLRTSLQVLDDLRRDHGTVVGLAEDHATVCVGIARELGDLQRHDEADEVLARAEIDLAQVATDRDQLVSLVRRQQGTVLWARNDRPKAIERMKAAVAAAEHWHDQQPQWLQPQEFLVRTLCDLGSRQNYVDLFDESNVAFRRAVALSEGMLERFPDDPGRLTSLVHLLRRVTQVLWDRFRREDLPEAIAYAARAVAVADRIPSDVDIGAPRWMLLALQAGVTESLGEPVDALWRAVDAALPQAVTERGDDALNQLAQAAINLARWQFRRGNGERSQQLLSLGRAAIAANRPHSDKLLVEIGWLDAQKAFAAGDAAAAAAAGAEVLAARNTWYGTRRAADCLRLAWCTTIAHGVAASSTAATTLHARAIELYGNVLETLQGDVDTNPKDPFYMLPWGFSAIRTAELVEASGDHARARELLTAALPKLAAVYPGVHRDQWEADTVAFGERLLARLPAPEGH